MNQDLNVMNIYSAIQPNSHIQNPCLKCNQVINDENSFDFKCDDETHSYHKDCLKQQIFQQINKNESQFIKCKCGHKFHSTLLRNPILEIETEQQNQLLNKLFNFQLDKIKLRKIHQYREKYTNFREEYKKTNQQIDYIIPFEQIIKESK